MFPRQVSRRFATQFEEEGAATTARVRGRDQILSIHMIQVGQFGRQSGFNHGSFELEFLELVESHHPGLEQLTADAMSVQGYGRARG